ncbi:MAG: hypothetical protein AB7U98_08790 [Candidatus Nitrosocosmicus sp.]
MDSVLYILVASEPVYHTKLSPQMPKLNDKLYGNDIVELSQDVKLIHTCN